MEYTQIAKGAIIKVEINDKMKFFRLNGLKRNSSDLSFTAVSAKEAGESAVLLEIGEVFTFEVQQEEEDSVLNCYELFEDGSKVGAYPV